MPYNYSYQLDPNPNLVPLDKVNFDPVTEEHRSRIEAETQLFRQKRRKDLIRSIVFFVISLLLIVLGVILWLKVSVILLFLPVFIALPFLIIAIISLISCVGFKVTGIKECRVTHRETHKYYTDNAYDMPVETSTDRVTVRIEDTGEEVSVVTDAYTQMHCIEGKKVWLLKTSKGTMISFI